MLYSQRSAQNLPYHRTLDSRECMNKHMYTTLTVPTNKRATETLRSQSCLWDAFPQSGLESDEIQANISGTALLVERMQGMEGETSVRAGCQARDTARNPSKIPFAGSLLSQIKLVIN